MTSLPETPILAHLFDDVPVAFAVTAIPVVLLYLDIYTFSWGYKWMSRVLVVPTLVLFWMGEEAAPVRCAGVVAWLRFAVAVAIMKLLDIHSLSLTNRFPTYTAGPPPHPALLSLILLTELRYESFTPNPIRSSPSPVHPFPNNPRKRRIFYSEPIQLLIHTILFLTLQCLPQVAPVKALGILHTIWIIWTAMQLCLRYSTSPPLFGPLYLADSLAGFWTETWHNAFAAPCLSLAYMPTLLLLSSLPAPIRPPRTLARAAAVIASFGLMAAFHMYALAPLLSGEGRWRIGVFFVANGVCTVGEAALWGRRRHWARRVCAWVVELGLASWTVRAVGVADGLLAADWRGLCRPDIRKEMM